MTEKEQTAYYDLTVLANLMVTMPEETMTKMFEGFPDPIEKVNYFVTSLRKAAEIIRQHRSVFFDTDVLRTV